MDKSLEIDNRSLVEECLKGDKEALNLFYLRFAPRMHRVIQRYVHDKKDAEDILHDGFIVAFTRLRSLREPEKVDYWLASIMRNLSLQFLQEQDLTQLLRDEEVADPPVIDHLIDMEVLESLIGKLPPGYQKVFRLSMLEKKSHKEIARILGIAPNSSSSQLFHAKLMMRRLITDYRRQAGILSLLLLGLGSGTVLWINRVSGRPDLRLAAIDSPVIMSQSVRKAAPAISSAEPAVSSLPAAASVGKTGSRKTQSITGYASNVETSIPSNVEPTAVPTLADTMTINRNFYADTDNTRKEADNPTEIHNTPAEEMETRRDISSGSPAWKDSLKDCHSIRETRNTSGSWSLIATADPGITTAINSRTSNVFSDTGIGNITGDYTDPDKGEEKNPESKRGITRGKSDPHIGSRDFSGYTEMPHKNDFPISFSLAVSHRLNQSISLEAGLSYTYLSTTFESHKNYSRCKWHYLGIPLRITFRSFTSGRLKLYGATGGSLEIPLRASADIWGENPDRLFEKGSFHSPCVWTLSASYGAALKLSDRFDLFIEPTVRLYLHNRATVPNIWSDNRIGLSLPIGLRFNL